MNPPLVTVLITARNRPAELALTLRCLRRQRYAPIELIIFDDASEIPLEPLILQQWPTATVIRNERPKGLVANRSKGMEIAAGRYIFSLDDDSCFTAPEDIERAVDRLETESELGGMSFLVFHGPALPPSLTRPSGRYVASFIGCGHVLRRHAVAQTGGYRDFYYYYGEEADLALRLIDHGWRLWLFPDVLIHHRVSQQNRSSSKILQYSIRNNLCTILLNMPLHRTVFQGTWRLCSHSWECLRLGEVGALGRGIIALLRVLPMIMQLRKPIQQRTLERYDALQTSVVDTPIAYENARVTLTALLRSFFRRYRARPRSRSLWDRRSGDIGQCDTVTFSHEYQKPARPDHSSTVLTEARDEE